MNEIIIMKAESIEGEPHQGFLAAQIPSLK